MVVVACSGGRAPASSADTTSVVAASSANVRPAPNDTCPANGLWATCSAIKRLESSGLAPRPDTADGLVSTLAPLSVKGARYLVGESQLELYFFADSSARTKAIASLDTTAYVHYDQPQTIRREPTLIQSANLIAILHSLRDEQRERVADALMAGPPQPSHTKTP